jgi:hypothetical protein
MSKPTHYTRGEVADIIEAFIVGTGKPYDWDDFCTFPIDDLELDQIRQRCAGLREEFPPDAVLGGYCGSEGLQLLEAYILYLRRRSS